METIVEETEQLPTEHPVREALAIYARRLTWFLLVYFCFIIPLLLVAIRVPLYVLGWCFVGSTLSYLYLFRTRWLYGLRRRPTKRSLRHRPKKRTTWRITWYDFAILGVGFLYYTFLPLPFAGAVYLLVVRLLWTSIPSPTVIFSFISFLFGFFPTILKIAKEIRFRASILRKDEQRE
jgi:hypothetical protein